MELQNNLSERKKFIGRENYIDEMNNRLKSEKCQIIVLCAFGGTGKTTLANEYGHRMLTNMKDMNYCVRWFRAENLNKLEDDWRQLATLLNIDTANMKRINLIDRVNNELNKLENNFLFILDNVETYEEIVDFIKCLPKKNTKILITTRNTQLMDNDRDDVSIINIDSFSLDEANVYLSENMKNVDTLLKSRLIDLIRFEDKILPLKLNLMVKYLEQRLVHSPNTPLEQILAELDEKHDESPSKQLTQHLFKSLTVKAKRVLAYLSIFDPELIDLRYVGELDENVEESMLYLLASGLVELNLENGFVRLHRLVRFEMDNFRENNKNEFDAEKEMINKILDVLISVAIDIDRNVISSKNNSESYTIEKHYIQIKSFCSREIDDMKDCDRKKLAKLRNKLGLFYLFYEINYERANVCLEQEANILCELYENDDEDKARCFLFLGISYSYLGDEAKAIEYKEKSLQMHERIFNG